MTQIDSGSHTRGAQGGDQLGDLITSLEDVGYFLWDEFIDISRCDVLRESLVDCYASLQGAEADHYPGTVHCLVDRAVCFRELIEDPVLQEIATSVVGDRCLIHSYNGLVVASDREMIQQRIHRDGWHRSTGVPLEVFQVLLMLDDFHEVNGATQILPQSHQILDVPTQVEFDDTAITVEGKAGSLLCIDSGLWHCAGQNTSGSIRRGITVVFSQPQIRQQIDLNHALSARFKRSLTSDTQKLLGLDRPAPGSVSEFYDLAIEMESRQEANE